MKIGILDCDPQRPSIIRRYGSYTDRFIQLLSPLQKYSNQPILFSRYNAVDIKSQHTLHENDLNIITGSKYSSYENLAWISQLEDIIRQLHQQKIKMLGICFGHQLIAQSLGGKVEKNINGWELGITATHISYHFKWMQPTRDFFFTLVSHQDQVTQLPDEAINFAKTNLCAYSGYTINKHILTFQGHPEFSKNYVKLIIKLQSSNISAEQRRNAYASLNQSIDRDLILNWIFNFIRQ